MQGINMVKLNANTCISALLHFRVLSKKEFFQKKDISVRYLIKE